MTNTNLQLSAASLAVLKRLVGLRLAAYRDMSGVWLIGYGHTKNVVERSRVTEGEACTLLDIDVDLAEYIVRSAVLVPLTQGQFDALVLFAFATGEVGPTMAKKLAAGDKDGAALEFRRFIYFTDPHTTTKVPSVVLVNRRSQEEAIFRG